MPDELTQEELVALDTIPCDAVFYWLAGERFDFETKQWVNVDAVQVRPLSSCGESEGSETMDLKLLRAIWENGEIDGD